MYATSDQDGLTDEDVTALYRWLLGRPPEGRDTVRAFRAYYPDMGAGRRAVFESDEFRRFYAGVTGLRPAGASAQDVLAQAFLHRAGGVQQAETFSVQPEMREGMRKMLRGMDDSTLALVIGGAAAHLADLVPLESTHGAILHVAPGFPAFIPGMLHLGGATAFRVAMGAADLLKFLRDIGMKIGFLLALGPPGEATLLQDLRPLLAPQAIIAIGPNAEGQEVACGWQGFESMPAWKGFSMHHAGGWHLPVAYIPPDSVPAAPNAEEYPALAVACIARNEQASIGHMLRSVLPVASFVAVLDTGSDDDTHAVARGVLGESGKPFVLERQVLERFDDMRNTCLDLVPGWVEWVLMLDADEALAPEDFAPLLALLRHADMDAYALPRYNYIGIDMQGPVAPYPDRQIRLLRNTAENRPRYTGAVHESVQNVPAGILPLDAAALGLDRGGPHIHHLVRRFRTPEEEARKQAYYKDLAARLG
jgi:hypothetical protein